MFEAIILRPGSGILAQDIESPGLRQIGDFHLFTDNDHRLSEKTGTHLP
jgi:hypothetical protein